MSLDARKLLYCFMRIMILPVRMPCGWSSACRSPKSRIDRAVFSEEEEVELSPGAALAFERFEVRR